MGTNEEKFRIGGVYWNHNRDTPTQLVADAGGGLATAVLKRRNGSDYAMYSQFRLADGRNVVNGEVLSGDACLNLLPGELHQVNGEWVPIADSISFTPSGEVEVIDLGADFFPFPVDAVESCRPELTWNKPTKVDRFPGFTVIKGGEQPTKPTGFISPDMENSSHQVGGHFGSAYLSKSS